MWPNESIVVPLLSLILVFIAFLFSSLLLFSSLTLPTLCCVGVVCVRFGLSTQWSQSFDQSKCDRPVTPHTKLKQKKLLMYDKKEWEKRRAREGEGTKTIHS